MTDLDKLLREVTKPARYTGGEWNSVVKDWESVPLRVALCFPDRYEIGMSNMAVPILYEILNRQPDALAERAYAPWVDMEEGMRAAGMPLFSLETKRPLRNFDVIGFSLGYELTYTNVLNMLDLAGIPVRAAERDDSHPLIIAGGSSALNPEPMTDFIDLFVIGDGEDLVLELLDCLRAEKEGGRERLLRKAAQIPGVYVPGLYRVEYLEDGTVKSITPAAAEASQQIQRRIVDKLPPPVTSPVVPYIEVVHDRGMIEIQRGCSRGCRFCQAGIIYRPVRERPKEEVVEAAEEIISHCGYDELSLVSLSSSDYAEIGALVQTLSERHPHLALSLPSLRIDEFSLRLMASLPDRSKTGLTFAPEAGSERLRRVINKNIPEEALLETAAMAFERGWTGLKLYFMLGLPTETEEDAGDIIRLVEKIRTEGRKSGGRLPNIRISVSTFVPKPHTPFQWVGQEEETSLNAKLELLQQGLPRKGVKLSWQSPELSRLEAVLSRGDRRLGRVIYRAWQLGARFDAWNERFRDETWQRAFRESGLEAGFYAHRERRPDEVLPWSHIDTGVTEAFLKRECQRALEGRETADCRYGDCSACGLQRVNPDCGEKIKSRAG